MRALNDQVIRSARAAARSSGKAVRLSDTAPGLIARCNPGGRVKWELAYKPAGSKIVQRFGIGTYPEMSIREARDRAAELRVQRNRGLDPRQQRAVEAQALRLAAIEAEQRLTVIQLVERFLDAKSDLRWVGAYRQMLYRDLVPTFGNKPAAELSAADVRRLLDDVVRRGAATQAVRLYETMRALLRWAVKREYLVTTPMGAVERPGKPAPRERVLSPAEIAIFWNRLDDAKMPVAFRQILRLQLLLGQRSGEVGGLVRTELSPDGLTWVLPGERSKNGLAHAVPLPPLARSIITDAAERSTHPRLLFPGARGAPMRSDTIAHELARAQSVFAFMDAEGRASPFTAHDLRRTAATMMRQLGISSDTIGVVLNHISISKAGVTERHYLHDDREMEKREALTRWQGALERILAGDDPFARRADDVAALEARMLGKRPVLAFKVVS